MDILLIYCHCTVVPMWRVKMFSYLAFPLSPPLFLDRTQRSLSYSEVCLRKGAGTGRGEEEMIRSISLSETDFLTLIIFSCLCLSSVQPAWLTSSWGPISQAPPRHMATQTCVKAVIEEQKFTGPLCFNVRMRSQQRYMSN